MAIHSERDMRRVELNFHGPFGWGGDKEIPSIYGKANRPNTAEGGVYLWTVLTPDGDELVFYVGQASDFRKRFKEHQGEQSIGWYHVYDPDTFVRDQKKLLWDGVYGHDREIDADFVSDCEKLRPNVTRFMAILRFHLAPVSADKAGGMKETEFLKRIEAGLAHHFYHHTGVVGKFQDEDVWYLEQSSLPRQKLRDLKRPPRDGTTQVICHTQAKIRCFPTEIIV